MKIKYALPALAFLGLSSMGVFAYSNQKLGAWPFSAPEIQSRDNLSNKNHGDIVYDHTAKKFFGWSQDGWINFSGVSGAGGALNVVSTTTNYTIDESNDVILANSSSGLINIYLPEAASSAGRVLRIKKVDSVNNNVVIDPDSTETIDGAATTTLNTRGETITIICDGSNWQILDRKIPSDWNDAGTVNITAVTSGAVTKGTTVKDKVRWRRVGSNMEIRIEYGQSAGGAGGTGTGNYLFAIPSGYSIDTSKVSTYSSSSNTPITNNVGTFAGGNNSSSISQIGVVIVYDSERVRFLGNSTVDNNNYFIGDANFPITIQAYYTANFSVPISGWNP